MPKSQATNRKRKSQVVSPADNPSVSAAKSTAGSGGQELSLSDVQIQKVAEQVVVQLQPKVLQALSSTRARSVSSEAQTTDVTSSGNVVDLEVSEPEIMVAESISEALDYNVTDAIKQKIINGEYIDLGQLLQRRTGPDKSKCLTIEDGQLVVQQKQSILKINDINQWTDAFVIFSSIYSAAHPESVAGLFKYIHTVRLGAKRSAGLGWKFYDEQYRLKKASNPSTSWGVVDQELWLLYMYYGTQSNNASFSSGNRYLKCYNFNFSGICHKAPCFYLHKCLNCSGNHPSIKCVHKNLYGQYSDFRSAGTSLQYPRFRHPGANASVRPSGFLAAGRPARGSFRFNSLRPVAH